MFHKNPMDIWLLKICVLNIANFYVVMYARGGGHIYFAYLLNFAGLIDWWGLLFGKKVYWDLSSCFIYR